MSYKFSTNRSNLGSILVALGAFWLLFNYMSGDSRSAHLDRKAQRVVSTGVPLLGALLV